MSALLERGEPLQDARLKATSSQIIQGPVLTVHLEPTGGSVFSEYRNAAYLRRFPGADQDSMYSPLQELLYAGRYRSMEE